MTIPTQQSADGTVEGVPRRTRTLVSLGVLSLVVLAFTPSLGGGWVWDDHYQIAGNESLDEPWTLLTTDVWGAAGQPATDLYRPLTVASHAALHWLLPGPTLERIVNVLIHLLTVFFVASAARGLGAQWEVSWFAAALFGVHTGASEPVAWISGRDELLAGALLLAAWAAFVFRRDALAGALLALTPFCKESHLLVPLAAGVWMLGRGRFSLRLFLPTVVGVAAYLWIRHAIDLPLPAGAAVHEPISAMGALLQRGVTLAVVPAAADALAPYRPAPVLGWIALAGGVGLLGLSWNRPIVASICAPLLIIAPNAPAAAQNGLVADRYFYASFAVLAGSLAAAYGTRRWMRITWAIPALLAVLTFCRAGDWTSDERIFGSSLTRNPSNPHAAFHVAHDLHARKGDCQSAIPLYGLALDVEVRAGNNLLACLLDVGRYLEATEIGPQLAERDPSNPNPAANTSRAHLAMDEFEESEIWAREALRRNPSRTRNWILLGIILGRQGHLDEAAEAYGEALRLSPGDVEATRGLDLATAGATSGSPR